MLFQKYLSESFCREFTEVKGSSLQLGIFMATVLGIKPLMDDWIPMDRLGEFKKICKKYGLKVREDVIFVNVFQGNLPDNIIGKKYLTTTSAYGYPVDSKTNGQIHLFISRHNNLLRNAMWYPVIIKNRVINQPRIDGLKYGYALGYPECCIKFFRRYNDWFKYSYLYEAYINTKNKASFLCNPFLKDTTFSYIYHMPCSYSCAETMKLTLRLRKEIEKREPKYVKLTDKYLKMPLLVIYEKKYYCFDGTLKGDEIKYKKFFFSSTDLTKDSYGEYLQEADTLKLKGRRIILLKRGKILNKIDVILNSLAPEFPFLIRFL
jgi:hypothetical protein